MIEQAAFLHCTPFGRYAAQFIREIMSAGGN